MCLAKSIILLLYPHSLSYHETTLWKLEFKEIPACLSKIDDLASCKISDDTISSSVYPKTPFKFPLAYLCIAWQISS